MQSISPKNVKSVFDAALEMVVPGDRIAYLEKTCADDPELRRKVDGLLRAHPDPGRFPATPARPADRTRPGWSRLGGTGGERAGPAGSARSGGRRTG